MSGVAVSQAVRDFGVEGQGWDEMLAGQLWDSAASVATTVVRALAGESSGSPVVVNVNVPNLEVTEMAGWRYTTVGRIPPRVIADATLEPKRGHPGSFRVSMKWGDAVSLPEGTDGGAVERGQVSVTLLGTLSDVRSPADPETTAGAEAAIGQALDTLFGFRPAAVRGWESPSPG
jgi:broad specificity polyphosphatase/5'/3'-nucleotidase SurE